MGTIYKEGDRWVASVDLPSGDGKRRRRRLFCATRGEAKKRLVDLEALHARGATIGSARDTVGRFLEDWLELVARPRLKPRSWESYEEIVRLHLVPSLGSLRLDDLQPTDVRRMLATKMREGLTGGRVLNIRACLRAALNSAMRDRRLHSNAAALAEPPVVARAKATPLSADETRALIEALKLSPWGMLFTMSLTTGLRRGELLGLRWPSVGLLTGRLAVVEQIQTFSLARVQELRALPPAMTPWLVQWVSASTAIVTVKSAAGRRELRLLPGVLELLVEHREHAEGDGLVFATSTGGPLTARNVSRAWRTALELAGVSSARLHDARHGAGSLLLEAGVDMKTVQAILGHASITTTMDVYAHVRQPAVVDAFARLDDLLKPRG